MVKRREKTKREQLHLSIEIFEKRYQLRDFSGALLSELSSSLKSFRYVLTIQHFYMPHSVYYYSFDNLQTSVCPLVYESILTTWICDRRHVRRCGVDRWGDACYRHWQCTGAWWFAGSSGGCQQCDARQWWPSVCVGFAVPESFDSNDW